MNPTIDIMYNKNNNLSVGFRRSADCFPDRPALNVDGVIYSYDQLARMSGFLSSVIKRVRVPANDLVGLFAYRSSVAYAGILSILGAGFGYVPLHPDYPVERSLRVLDLSGVDIVIVSRECQEAFDKILPQINKSMTFIMVDLEQANLYGKKFLQHQFLEVNALVNIQSDLLCVEPISRETIAYLLFTSGSTGEPKGVPVSHHNVRSYVEFITARYDINENDRCSQMHDLTFDFSVHDIYPTWEKGACLCIPTTQDKLLPVGFIQRNKLTSWASVPSIAVIIDKYGRLEQGAFPFLRLSFFCGEALYMTTADKWQKAACNSRLVNLYGPTEATMAISYYDWDSRTSPEKCVNGVVPIGRIFDGQKARIICEDGHIAKVNEPGELCLSGSQVTRGYWKNSQQTAAQYVTFNDEGDVIWYRTGDRVQLGQDGCLYYLGRIDNQVKVLGNRVELGEVEKVLRESSGLELAVVIPWPVQAGNASGLVAFLCCNGEDVREDVILEYCRVKLPKYMTPTRVYCMDEMPFNANGKVDRLSLKQLLEREL